MIVSSPAIPWITSTPFDPRRMSLPGVPLIVACFRWQAGWRAPQVADSKSVPAVMSDTLPFVQL